MNAEIKEKWVSALLSGKYAQTRQTLRDPVGFCCLGVLTDLYAQGHEDGKWKEQDDQMIVFDSAPLPDGRFTRDYGQLPTKVREWAEITSESGETGTLMEMNDDLCRTFPEIAAYIRVTM